MYCNKCGRAVRNGDLFCSHCGNKLDLARFDDAGEEVIYNLPHKGPGLTTPQDIMEKQPHMPAAGEYVFREETEEQRPVRKMDNSEFVWDVSDFKKEPKKTEDFIVDWRKLEIYKAEEENGKKSEEADRPVSIEDIQADMDSENEDAARDTARIEKFYTFNRKNEEFQKLLDREYDRISESRRGEGANEAGAETDTATDAQAEGEPEEKAPEQQPKADEAEPAAAAEPVIPAEEQAAPEEDHKEEHDIDFAVIEDPGDEANASEEEFEDEPEETNAAADFKPLPEDTWGDLGAFDPVAHIKEAEIKRNEEITMAGAVSAEGTYGPDTPEVLDNESLIRIFDTKELQKDVLELELEKERRKKAAAEAAAEKDTARYQKGNTLPVPNPRLTQQLEAEAAASAATIAVAASEIKKEEPKQAAQPQQPETAKEPAGEPASKPTAAAAPVDKDTMALAFDEWAAIAPRHEFGPEEESPEGSSGGQKFLAFVIAIVGLALICELVLAGIRYLAPNSGIGRLIDEKLGSFVVDFRGEEEPAEAEEPAEEEEPAIPEGTPFALSDLVMHAQNFNKNIKNIKPDASLGYDPTATYSQDAIINSVPLENNIWYRDLDGNPVYIDRCMADLLVKYDSLWVEYATEGNTEIFDLIQPGSNLEKSCKSLKNPGKLGRTFETLDIGQVRKTENGYLIWVRETVKNTDNGKEETKVYNCVYFAEETGFELKLADCYQL